MMEKKANLTYFFIIAACAFILCFPGLWKSYEFSGDESRVMGISAEMFLEQNYLVPKLNHKPFLEYPPLYYWTQAGSFSLFGMNPFAVKLPSALAAFGTVLLVYLFGLKLRFSPRAALISSLVLLTSSSFLSNSHTGRVDSMLMFFIFLAVSHFPFQEKEKKYGTRLLFTIGTAGALLTKGMIGPFYIGIITGGALLIRDILEKRFRIQQYLLLISCMAAGLIPVLIWCIALFLYEGTEGLQTLWLENLIGRIIGTVDDHAEPFYYYFARLPELFLPWIAALPFALWFAFQYIRKRRSRSLIFLCWALIFPFIMLSICSNKRVVYLLPLAPFTALLCGVFFSSFCSKNKVRKFFRKLPDLSAAVLAVLSIAGIFLVGKDLLIYPLFALLLLLPVPMIRKNRNLKQFFWLTGCSAVITAVLTFCIYSSGKKNNLRPMYEYVKQKEAEGFRIFLITGAERTKGAAYYFMKRYVPLKKPSREDLLKKELWILRNGSLKLRNRFPDNHAVTDPVEYFQAKEKKKSKEKKQSSDGNDMEHRRP